MQSIAATAGADALIVYYTGHGIRDEARRNFLLPVEASISRPEDIAVDGIDAEELIQAVRAAQPKLGLIVLDACRNNPFTAALGNKSTSKGLARRGSDGLNGVLVAYAAEGGQVAEDGRAGSGSPFALAFARYIATPGIPLLALLDQIGDDVVAATGGKQTPTRDGNLRANAMLIPAVLNWPAVPEPVTLATANPEREAWDMCTLSATTGPCHDYLKEWPAGIYAQLAQTNIHNMEPTPLRTRPTAAPTMIAPNSIVADNPRMAKPRRALAVVIPLILKGDLLVDIYTQYKAAGGSLANLESLANANDPYAMLLLG